MIKAMGSMDLEFCIIGRVANNFSKWRGKVEGRCGHLSDEVESSYKSIRP